MNRILVSAVCLASLFALVTPAHAQWAKSGQQTLVVIPGTWNPDFGSEPDLGASWYSDLTGANNNEMTARSEMTLTQNIPEESLRTAGGVEVYIKQLYVYEGSSTPPSSVTVNFTGSVSVTSTGRGRDTFGTGVAQLLKAGVIVIEVTDESDPTSQNAPSTMSFAPLSTDTANQITAQVRGVVGSSAGGRRIGIPNANSKVKAIYGDPLVP